MRPSVPPGASEASNYSFKLDQFLESHVLNLCAVADLRITLEAV